MSLALMNRPGVLVFLDDDADFLESLALALPPDWPIELFLHPQDCINHLQQEPPRWEQDLWMQQQIVERWHAGQPLIPQIVQYWREQPARRALTRVALFDYAMPAIDGLSALAELPDWRGRRVLLTGRADERIAVQAFNRGLIDQYLPKQTEDMARRLVDLIDELLAIPDERHEQLWHATLSPAQVALLHHPAAARDLRAWAASRWVEHVVIGQPFGMLGLAADGTVDWLQLETPAGLADLAGIAAMHGLDAATCAAVRAGEQLPGIELALALDDATVAVEPVLTLGGGVLLAAAFTLGDAWRMPAGARHADWLAARGPRRVRD